MMTRASRGRLDLAQHHGELIFERLHEDPAHDVDDADRFAGARRPR